MSDCFVWALFCLFVCLHILVSIFVGFACVCFLIFFVVCFICLLKKERKKRWAVGWVGRIFEDLCEEKRVTRIYCIQFFFKEILDFSH